mgnify:FL=1
MVVYRAKLPVGKRYTMGTPDETWRTIVAAWSQLDAERIVQDVMRFSDVLDSIIAADGAYVADKDLRNGHRQLMRRLVRGGMSVGGGDSAVTAARLQKGLEEVKKSWEGMTGKYMGMLNGGGVGI